MTKKDEEKGKDDRDLDEGWGDEDKDEAKPAAKKAAAAPRTPPRPAASSDDDDDDEDDEVDEDEDEDEEDDDEDEEDEDEEDEDDEDEEDEEEASASGSDEDDDDEEDEDDDEVASATPAQRGSPKRRELDDDDDEDDDEEDVEPAAASDDEDPYWWAPHAVLTVLVLFGLAGFFGLLNRTPLVKLAAPIAAAHAETESKPASPPTPATPTPPGQQQPQRELFGAKHLLVQYQGSMRAGPNITRTKDEAKARATEAAKKAKDGKTKFEDVVKEYTDEPGGAARGGDLGKFPRGAMAPDFQNAVEKLKVNEVSDVVETPFGFHVILRTQ